MTYGTTTNAVPQAITLDDIEKVVAQLEAKKMPSEWMVASPDGRVFKGTPDEMMMVLMPYHSLMKTPTFGELLKEPKP